MIGIGSASLAVVAATAVSIPILIHLLFRRRKQPIDWPSMELLRRAVRRVERRRRLERLLLLLTRCLLVTMAGLGIAAPFWGTPPGSTEHQQRTLMLLIDNGVASSERSGSSTILEELKAQARAELDTLGPGDRVGFVPIADPQQGTYPPSLDIETVRSGITAITQSESPTNLPGAIRALRAKGAFSLARAQWKILSAWRTGSTDFGQSLQVVGANNAPTMEISKPLTSQPINFQLRSVATKRSTASLREREIQLLAQVSRSDASATEAATIVVQITDTNGNEASGPAHFNPGQTNASASILLRQEQAIAPAEIGIEASITTDDQPADNTLHTVIRTTNEIRVALIDRPRFDNVSLGDSPASVWIERALTPGESGAIEVESMEPSTLSAKKLRPFSAAILLRPDLCDKGGWEALQHFVSNRGVLIITPPPTVNSSQWTKHMVESMGLDWKLGDQPKQHNPATTLSQAQPQHPILRLIWPELEEMAPTVICTQQLSIDVGSVVSDVVLRTSDGTPFITATPVGSGMLVLMSITPELDWTNLPAKPLMVPLLQELVRAAKDMVSGSPTLSVGSIDTHTTGATTLIEGRTTHQNKSGIATPIDPATGACPPLETAGLYEALDTSGRLIATIPVAVDRNAAAIEPVDETQLSKWLAPLQTTATPNTTRVTNTPIVTDPTTDNHPGKQLAGACFILAIAAMGIETLLSRKYARREMAS